jgi:hypothetical protein
MTIGRQGIGRNLPASAAKTVRQIVEGVAARLEAILDLPGNRWNAGLRITAENDLERGQLADLVGYILRRIVASCLDLPISLLSQSKDIVILTDDLAARP